MGQMLISVSILVAVAMTVTWLARRARRPRRAGKAVVGGLLGLNGIIVALCAVALLTSLGTPMPVLAQSAEAGAGGTSSNVALGAALATGLACIGAGIAVGIAGAAAIGGITEKPEILGRTLIFVGLAEGIAIYGLIISFLILQS